MLNFPDRELLNRFLNMYAEIGNEDDCWIWKGYIDKSLGYGRTWFLGHQAISAHRAVYLMAYGEYPRSIKYKKTCIRHLCSNRLCVNPRHLALGTYADNGRDASLLERRVKITKAKLAEAVKMRNKGMTYKKISKIIGVTDSAISMALRGKTFHSRVMLEELAKEANN